MDAWITEYTNNWTKQNARMHVSMSDWAANWMDGWVGKQVDEWWTDAEKVGWTDEWTSGRMVKRGNRIKQKKVRK